MLKQTVTVLWQYLVKSSLFLFSLLIVLFHNTVVKFHISCIFKSIWQRIFPSTFSANSNNQEVVDESYKLSRDEMALFAMQYGGVVARVVSNPLFKTFYTTRGELKGLVPYRQSWNTVVVVGDPICNTTSSECFEFVCEQFYKYCSQFNYQVIYAAVSEEFVQHINKMNTNSSMLQFGETLLFNTNDSTKKRLKGRKQRGLASKINQAKKQGITVQEFYLPVADSQEVVSTASSTTISPVPNDYNSALKDKILQVAESWSNNRTGVQAYLTPIDIFGDPIGKRWFYATQNDQVVAVAVIMLVERLRCYMIKNVLVTPNAPKGISELMVMHMFETIENEPYNKAKVLTFGPGPSPMFLKEQKGFDFSTSILFKLLRMCMENGYLSSVSNTFSFRKKFVPDTAEPAFVVFYRQQSMSLYNALSILHTFHIVSSFLNSSEE